jgi:hypothetical protein
MIEHIWIFHQFIKNCYNNNTDGRKLRNASFAKDIPLIGDIDD